MELVAPTTLITVPMAHPRSFLAPLSRITAPSIASARPSLPQLASLPLHQTSIRCKTTKAPDAKKRKARKHYLQSDLRKADQFSLIDAMQYVHPAYISMFLVLG
jgi:large subunit ribosomal protein L1